MIIDFVFGLAVFKLVGGVAHAVLHLNETRRLRDSGETPYVLPAVYQAYATPSETRLAA